MNPIDQLGDALLKAIELYQFVIIAWILLSWVLPPHHEIMRALHQITNPYLKLFRGILRIGMFDFSPILAFLALDVISYLIRSFIF